MGKNPENLERVNKSETKPTRDLGAVAKKFGKTALNGAQQK